MLKEYLFVRQILVKRRKKSLSIKIFKEIIFSLQKKKLGEIEKKLEEQNIEEKEQARQEKQQLFDTRRKHQSKLQRMEQKLELVARVGAK